MKKSTLKQLLYYARPHLWIILLSLAAALIHVTALVAAPIFIGRAIDRIVGAGDVSFSQVLTYCFYLAGAILTATVFGYASTLLAGEAAFRTVKALRFASIKKINALPLAAIDNISHGDTVNRLTSDAERVADGLTLGITQIFTGTAIIIGTLGFMLRLNLIIAAVVALITPLSVLAAALIAGFGHKMLKKQAAKEGALSGESEEYISGALTVKLYNYAPAAEAKFDAVNREIKKHGTRAVFITALVNPSTRFINGLVFAAVALTGAYLILNPYAFSGAGAGADGTVTVGMLAIFLSYAMQYARPFNEITAAITEAQAALVSAERIFALLKQADEAPCPAFELPSARGNVAFEDIDFSYLPSDSAPFIKGLNLKAEEGKKIALIGKTGCGKTTLINLLMRFYDVQSGCVSIDGICLTEISRRSLRSSIGMVLQDAWLFKGSVLDNIAFAKPNADITEVISAAKKARIHGFVSSLKDGYDTVIEPHSLSQGQKQLLSIARVFLARPPIIVLDEATSNIDAHTEARIQEALAEITKGHTTIIVAHRLKTIQNADLIVVMADGSIVEQGTHSELSKLNGHYSALLKAME